MLLTLRLVVLAAVVIMFAFFLLLLQRQKLELKYCLIWLAALVGVAVFCIFPSLLDKISLLLGIETPVYAFFLLCIVFLACICISLTVVVSKLSNRLRELTQNIAIMEFEKKNTNQAG